MNVRKILKSKKVRYGSLSVIFTVSFIAVIIALNLILTAIASNVNLTVDLTQQKLYSISDETKAVVDNLGDDLDITIYFLSDRDLYAADKYTLMVCELAEEYEKLYPGKIRVEYKNIVRDPSFVKEYYDETLTAINPSNVIIKGKYHARVLTLDAFFYLNEAGNAFYAFNGEVKFTGAILQCSIAEPQVITFTKGHGETYSKMLQNILTEAGFELQYKDLSYEEIDSRTRILIVSNPSKDFTRYEGGGEDSDNSAAGNIIGAEEMAETEKIGIYLGRSNGYNSMIVLVNSSTPKLPTLEEYLLNSWGLGYNAGRQIIDTSHSIGNDGSSVVGKYITKIDEETGKINENTVGYNIHKTASSIGTGSKTVFKNAVELYYNADEADQDVTIETVISTNDTAEIVYTDSEGNEIRNDAGETPLMLVSTVFDYGENNVGLYGYVMLVSSTDFASDTYLVNKYGNNNVLLGAARVMSTERVIPDLEYKTFVDEAMDIELGTATALTWMVSAILPTMIIIIGLVVFFKRRHL